VRLGDLISPLPFFLFFCFVCDLLYSRYTVYAHTVEPTFGVASSSSLQTHLFCILPATRPGTVWNLQFSEIRSRSQCTVDCSHGKSSIIPIDVYKTQPVAPALGPKQEPRIESPIDPTANPILKTIGSPQFHPTTPIKWR
jgi:hypothetical protein